MKDTSKKANRRYLGVVTSIRNDGSKAIGWIVTNDVGFGWWDKRGKDLVELRFVNPDALAAHPGDGVVFEWGGKCVTHVDRASCIKDNILLALSYARTNPYIAGAITGWRNKCDRHVLSLVLGDDDIDQESTVLLLSSLNEFLQRFPKRERRDVAYGWMMDRWFSPRMKDWLVRASRQLDEFPVVKSSFADFIPRNHAYGCAEALGIVESNVTVDEQMHKKCDFKGEQGVMNDMHDMGREKIEMPKSVLEANKEALHEMYLSKIGNRLNELDTPTDDDRKRWVWELIQNAKDSVVKSNPRRTVCVEIRIDGDKVCFSHNGEPFTPRCRNGLLYQYSKGKREEEGSTGRFGTGFMSTHCLSRVVHIQADMLDDEGVRGFEITIHREGQNDKEQLDGLKKMEASSVFYAHPFGKTTFTYHVGSDSGRRAIELGVREIKTSACIVMLFCPELEKVSLWENGALFSVRRGDEKELGDGVSEVVFEIDDGENHSIRTFLFVRTTEHSDILSEKYCRERNVRIEAALEFDAEKSLVPHDRSVYCVFPVIGSERQLRFPMLVNSPDFELTEEREAVRLLQGERTDNGKPTPDAVNRAILSKISDLYKKLIHCCLEMQCVKLYLLADGLKDVVPHEKTDVEWLRKNTLSQLRSVLLNSPVAQPCHGGEKITLAEAAIVRDKDGETETKLCRLLSRLKPDEVGSVLQENHDWADRVWNGKDIKLWSKDRLGEFISAKKNWNCLPRMASEDVPIWYNDFLSCVGEDVYKKYALLPDMTGNFHLYDDAKFCEADHVGEDAFKLIKQLGGNAEGDVLSLKVEGVALPRKFNLQSCSAKINAAVRFIVGKRISDEEKVSELMPLLSAVSNDADVDFRKRREDVLKCACSLFGMHEKGQEKDEFQNLVLAKNSWDEVDSWVVPAMARKISGLQNIVALKGLLPSTEPDAIGFLNEYYGIMLAQKMQFWELGIFPNQHGEFKKRTELWAQDGIIDDQIEDIACELDKTKGDFRAILMDERCRADVQPERKMKLSDVCSFVDTYIYSKRHDDKQVESFREAVRQLLDGWKESNPSLFTKDNFPKIFDAYNDLEMEIVHTPEERKLMNGLFKSFSKKELIDLLRDGRIPPSGAALKGDAGGQQEMPSAEISFSDGQYAGLSDEAKAAELLEAKRLVHDKLKNEGFDFTQGLCENDYSLINGVKKGDVEHPLVVHSYLDKKRQLQLNAKDWEQLFKPHSMLFLRTEPGRVVCVPFRELILNREKINLSFSTKNLEIKDRIAELRDVMRWFKGLQFNFGSLIPEASGTAEFFDLPEQSPDKVKMSEESAPDREEDVLS